jgi:phosphoglycerate kinase
MFELPLVTGAPALLGKHVLLRLDLNVPIENGKVRDGYRIEQSLPTLNFLRESGARTIILSHIGKGKAGDTLLPVSEYLNNKFPVTFLPSLMSTQNKEIIGHMLDGDVIMLENLRHNEGEEKNDPEFVSYLADLGEVYVNDAFSVSHRAHASVVGLASRLPHYAGLLLAEEVRQLARAFEPERPFLFILGGAKISTKIPLLKKFLNSADRVFVGGAIANNFFKVAGHEIGKSVFDKDELDGLAEYLTHERLILPVDVVVKNDAGSQVKSVSAVTADEMIVDVGPETIHRLQSIIGDARTVVWNGPLGYYEAGFTEGTRELLGMIAGSGATSIIGGGDTVALIDEMGAFKKFSFVSTGGGAMLDFLSSETLPGIEALMAK